MRKISKILMRKLYGKRTFVRAVDGFIKNWEVGWGVDCVVWTAPVTGPGEQGNEPTCCIQGREFNKIAGQLLASQEGTVFHGVIC
jgi:hypothetical protein